jgi:hypothetical protein
MGTGLLTGLMQICVEILKGKLRWFSGFWVRGRNSENETVVEDRYDGTFLDGQGLVGWIFSPCTRDDGEPPKGIEESISEAQIQDISSHSLSFILSQPKQTFFTIRKSLERLSTTIKRRLYRSSSFLFVSLNEFHKNEEQSNLFSMILHYKDVSQTNKTSFNLHVKLELLRAKKPLLPQNSTSRLYLYLFTWFYCLPSWLVIAETSRQ